MLLDNETGEAIDARARVVARARAELGIQDPNKYYRAVAPQYLGHVHDKAWCGVFALWCLVSEGLCAWQWEDSKGFVWRLDATSEPLPGDVAVFERSPSGAVLWHHAVVETMPAELSEEIHPGLAPAPLGRPYVHTLDGNALPTPLEGVEARIHPVDANVRFYSIAQLISEPATLVRP